MNVGVIGGKKGLGKTIATFLKKEEFCVTITGRDESVGVKVSKELNVNYSNDNKKTASLNQIIIISVPIDAVETVVCEIANYLNPGTLVLDVASVKQNPTKVMEKYLPTNVEFIPTHPVFGPRTTSLEGQVMVLTPIKKGKWYEKVVNYLKNHKTQIVESTPEKHDKMMAIVQILTHFSYISTASAINKLGVDIKTTRLFASPIYNLMVDMIARITSQNPYLTYFIQKENKNGDKVRDVFFDSVLELKEVLSNSDEEKFFKIAIDATKNLDDIPSALGRSDKAIGSLTQELNLFKKSIGCEIAVNHIYSEKIHFGKLISVDPNFIILENPNSKTKSKLKLKIANVELLSKENLIKWKRQYCPSKVYEISAIFSKTSKPEIIKDTILKNDNVLNVKVMDIYNGSQIDDDKISITFSIETFNKKSLREIEILLSGFGAIIL
jgi:prephenate dehydrogenase